jgi:hypothetical protein
MKKCLCVLVLLCSLLVPLDGHAQFGQYTRSGGGAGGAYSLRDIGSTVGGRAGYMVAPSLELGASVGRFRRDTTALTRTGVGPYLAFYPARQEEGYAVSIMMTASYRYLQFSGALADRIEADGQSVTGHAFRFGTGLFAPLRLSSSIRLVPFVGASFTRRSRAGDLNAQEVTSLNFRGAVQGALTSSASLVVTPFVLIGDDGTNRYGASASVVVSLGSGDE